MKVISMFVLVFFLTALLGGIFGIGYYYVRCNQVLAEEVWSHLESVAQSRAQHIETFLDEKKQTIKQLSTSITIEDLFLIDKTHSEYDIRLEKVNRRLFTKMNLSESVYEIFLLDYNGKIIASSDESKIGLDRSNDSYFLNAHQEVFIKDFYSSETTSRDSIAMSVPCYNGVLVERIDKSIFEDITFDKTGLGETGQTYLINKESYAITPLLSINGVSLKWKIDTINSRNCLNHSGYEHVGHSPTEVFLNYNGEKVIGSHFPILETGWCLLAEIDEAEILGSKRQIFQRNALISFLIITATMTLVGFLIGKYLDKTLFIKKGKKKL